MYKIQLRGYIKYTSLKISINRQKAQSNIITQKFPSPSMLQKLTSPLDYNPIHSTPKQPFTTTTGKCVGFISMIILTFIFISKCITVFDKQVIYINSNIYEWNDVFTRQKISFDITSSIISIYVVHRNQTGVYHVTVKNQYQHGINGTAVMVTLPVTQKTVRLVDCSDNDRPVTYCLPNNVKLQISYGYKFSFIQISPCKSEMSTQCVEPSGQYQIQISLRNTIINPFDSTYSKITFYKYKIEQAPIITLPINEVNIQSDQSVLPLTFLFDDVRTNCTYQIDINNGQTAIQGFNTFVMLFAVSNQIKRYERRFKKVDVALAEVLAISAVIGIVCRLVFSGYNNWVYERYIISKEIEKQSMVEEEQRDKYSRSNSGIIKYIKWQFSKKQDKKQQQQLFKQASDHQKRMMKIMNQKLTKMSEEFNNRLQVELRKRVCKCKCGCEEDEKKEVVNDERQKRKKYDNMNEEGRSMIQSVSSMKINESLHQRLL